MGIQFLTGERLYLQPIEEKDIPTLLKWINDPAIRNYLTIRFPFNSLKEKEWIQKLYSVNTEIALLIVLKENDKPIGVTGLHQINWVNRRAVFGIFIGETKLWNKGYGREATELMVDYGFTTLNLHKILLEVYDFNERGINSYLKCGFVKEAVLKKHSYKNGKYHDLVIMSIFRKDIVKRSKISHKISQKETKKTRKKKEH